MQLQVAISYERGKYRGEKSVFVGRILGFMAGREAEVIVLGDSGGGDEADLRKIRTVG